MEKNGLPNKDRVLVVGATGFVGKRLIPELIMKTTTLRLLARNPAKVAAMKNSGGDIEVIQGDLLSGEGLEDALRGIHTAYYLVHSMGGKSIFKNTEYAEKDKQAARNFVSAANKEGLKRLIYLGALGERGDNLSEHLRSRAEVATFLSIEKTSFKEAVKIAFYEEKSGPGVNGF